MYLDFFQLQREPFQVTPDPAFFYLSPGHREALAALIYGVQQRKGFIALTGEVGVGKTTILRAFLEQIDQERAKVIYLLNANVAFDDLLKMLLQELDVEPEAKNVFQMVNQLHRALIDHFRQDRNVVLIVDEAQNMPAETLEGLRVLSNLETATDKLLQIVFCGQPEFDEKLARSELRQLQQRIAVRATVVPLTDAEGSRYIQYRLSKAGVPERPIFTRGAMRRILREAQGIPRLINILCDSAMVTAFGYQERQVKGSVAKEIIADRKAQVHPRPVRWRLPAVGITAAAMVAGVLLSRPIDVGLMPGVLRSTMDTPRRQPVPPIAEIVALPTQPVLVAMPGTPVVVEPQTTATEPNAATLTEPQPKARAVLDAPTFEEVHPAAAEPDAATLTEPQPKARAVLDAPTFEEVHPAAAEPDAAKLTEPQPKARAVHDALTHVEVQPAAAEPVAAKMIEQEPVVRVVKPGDRLLDLVEEIYGVREERLVQLVKSHNSQIKNSHLIFVGDRLIFPPDDRQEPIR